MAQGAPEERPQGATTRSGQGTPKEELEPKSRQSHAQPLSATLPFFIFFLPAGNPSLPRDLAVFFSFFPAGNPNLPHDLAVFFPSSPRETPTFPVTWPFSSLLPR